MLFISVFEMRVFSTSTYALSGITTKPVNTDSILSEISCLITNELFVLSSTACPTLTSVEIAVIKTSSSWPAKIFKAAMISASSVSLNLLNGSARIELNNKTLLVDEIGSYASSGTLLGLICSRIASEISCLMVAEPVSVKSMSLT